MMGRDGSAAHSLWREDLYARCLALSGQVQAIVGSSSGLQPHKIDELFARLIEQSSRAVGEPGAAPAGAERWPDNELKDWLCKALRRDVIDEVRSQRDAATGELKVAPTPIDELPEDIVPVHARAETVAHDRAGVSIWTTAVQEVAGDEAAKLLLLDEVGVRSPSEQRALTGMTTHSRRMALERLDNLRAQIIARAQPILLFIPERLVAWWTASIGGGAGRIAGASFAAITIAISGGVAVEKTTSKPAKPQTVPAVFTQGPQSPATTITRATQTAIVRQERQQKAANRRAVRRSAAKAKARRERERKAAAAKSAAATEFAPSGASTNAPSTSSAAPSTGSSGTSGGLSAAEKEFLPSGQ